jgi:hypothetical protein
MSIAAKFTFNGQQLELSETELVQLQEALTFALGGGTSTASKARFGSIQVERSHNLGKSVKAFKQDKGQSEAAPLQTDC